MRWLRRAAWSVCLVLIILPATVWSLLHASLPRLEGSATVPGMTAPVTATRDALGTLAVEAANRNDLARALGYVHAQERFFEMDLMRRNAAGELAELVGTPALQLDRRHRLHRFRPLAAAALAAISPAEREVIDAYTGGVNAGLADLSSRPWEYWLLRVKPEPWRREDCALVIYTMFLDLNDGENRRELDLSRWRAALPEELINFLVAPGSNWDAPLRGDAYPPLAVPGEAVFDLRKQPPPSARHAAKDMAAVADRAFELLPGSNNFAVGGALTAGGTAIVADDMHLTLRAPNIWFRARLRYPDPAHPGTTIDLNGVTLPGTPALVAGSNGHVAWGFTNSYGDWADWVRVQSDPADAQRYRVPEGWATLEHQREVLHVHGAPDEVLDIAETRWGPIAATDADGTPLALAWTAHDPHVLNLKLLDLETVADVTQALDLAPRIGMPAQNFVVGDAQGHIGWTLTGNGIPQRRGYDAGRPADFSVADVGWNGWVDPAHYPRIENPPDARLWSANARTVDGDWLALEGDGGFDLGARAQQIRDDLHARDHFSPTDLLAVQLDDRAVFLTRWQALLAGTLAADTDPALAELRRLTATWNGHAATGSVDFRLVRRFRGEVIDAVMAPFIAAARQRYPEFQLPGAQGYEAAVWTLLQARPAHLLDPQYADWDSLLRACAAHVAREAAAQPGGLAARTWGERNTASIRHPLSAVLPATLARYLDMPANELPGDSNMPRVQAPEFGASERFAIMPGHEDQSYLMMPGGQSDHPMSPFHGAGHADWVAGKPTPLLPGPAIYTLRFVP